MKYFVYFLRSKSYNHWYIGCSANPTERLRQHNKGETKSTKPFRPWIIAYTEEFNNKKEAFRREWHLKHPAGYQDKLEIVKKLGGVA